MLSIAGRSRKQKCIVKASNPASCAYCDYQSLECSLSSQSRPVRRAKRSSYTTITQAKPSKPLGEADAPFETSELPPSEVCEDLVRVYFSTLHDTHHALFHQPTFIREFKEGKVPDLILLAIFALVARYGIYQFCT